MTDRKHQDLAVRESEARYRALIQTLPDAIIGVNIEGGLFLPASRQQQIWAMLRWTT